MADTPYTLYCEYVHCCGKKMLKLGETKDREAAVQWALSRNQDKKRPTLPDDDLIRTCPVRHCPAKLQIPRYGFRAVGD